jgi:hypothetical protein
MDMNTRHFLCSIAGLALLTIAARSSRAGDPAETKLTAHLVWGTNEEKPADRELKPISEDIEKRLRRIFKWRSYFQIERKDFGVATGKAAKVEMSKECRLEVARIGPEEFEIQLFGKGQLVVKKRQRIIAGETVVLGGDDKNDNAWFVVVGTTIGKVAPK